MNKIKSMIVNVGLFFSALLLVSVAEAETIIRTDGVMTINAGPIWNNADAQRKCPELARNNGGVWTGEWWTTVPGKMSVCQISIGTRPDKKEDPSWNGFSVKYVNGGDLAFSNVKHNQWFEYNAQGAHSFTFREVSRDRWTVYLRDDSRGVNIILDLGRAKIVYSDDTGREFDYRDIVKTSTKAVVKRKKKNKKVTVHYNCVDGNGIPLDIIHEEGRRSIFYSYDVPSWSTLMRVRSASGEKYSDGSNTIWLKGNAAHINLYGVENYCERM